MEQDNEVKLEVQMDDTVACGQYINMVVVNHNDSEFVIDCIYAQLFCLSRNWRISPVELVS